MHPKQHSILHRMGVYCKHFALGFALICTQLTLSSASAQTSEPSAQTIKQITALFERGKIAYSKGDFQQAIRNLTQVIAIYPNFAEAYNNRGLAYKNLKDYSSAIRDYTQAIALNPNYAEAYVNRGIAYTDLRDLSSAYRDYTQAIALNPNLAVAYNNRAVILAVTNDYRNATRDARKACSLGNCYMLEALGKNGHLRD